MATQGVTSYTGGKISACCLVFLCVCLFVCQFVSMFVRMITSERLNVGRSNLSVRHIVQKSRPSLKVRIKGQGHQEQKTKNFWVTPIAIGRSLHAARSNRRYHCVPPGSDGLRRWENQHMMSSCSQFNCVVRGLGASFLYKCPILRNSDLRQHGFLVR